MRFSHQPDGYRCPFCRVAAGEDLRDDYTKQSDVVYRDEMVTAFISSAWWPANPGHVLVVPNGHYENVYEIPDEVLAAVQVVGKRIALALRVVYDCAGTSFRQHNEPGGDQEVWHYHLHVFPRHRGDALYARTYERRDTTPAEREPYTQKLRAHFAAGSATAPSRTSE
jgi:histidine triad (HIT) family protein